MVFVSVVVQTGNGFQFPARSAENGGNGFQFPKDLSKIMWHEYIVHTLCHSVADCGGVLVYVDLRYLDLMPSMTGSGVLQIILYHVADQQI